MGSFDLLQECNQWEKITLRCTFNVALENVTWGLHVSVKVRSIPTGIQEIEA